MNNKNHPKKLIQAALVIALLLSSAKAYATTPSVLPETDAALRYFFNTISEGGDLGFEGSPMAVWMGTFNSIMMIIGGMLAAYTLVAGTINTANDGEFLGRKWSGAWLPIRTALGATMLLPAFNGFCLAQVIVLWMAQQGSLYATRLWDTFAGDLASMSQIKTIERRDEGYEFARDLMKANICHAALEKSLQEVAEVVDGTAISINPISTGKAFGYQLGVKDTGSGPIPYRSVGCGEFIYTYQDLADEAATQLQSTASNQALLNRFISTAQREQAAQFARMEARFLATAREFVNDPTIDTIGIIKQEVDAYNALQNTLAHGFTDLPSAQESLVQNLRQDGWIFAGTYYMKLISIQQTINSITNIWPALTKEPSSDDDLANQYVANFTEAFAQAYPEQTGLRKIVDITYKEGSEDKRSLIDKAIDYVNPTKPFKLINDIFEGVTVGMVEVFKQGGNPITTAQAIGDILIGAAWAILTVGLIMSVPTLGGSTMLAVPLGFGLLGLGGMLSIMIPLSPYLMWVACVFSWFVGVVMAIIGAPLWAVAHLNPDQDGIVGKTGQGYMLILQLFLKPSLMVIGFLCALILAVPFGDFVGATFVEALKLSQSTSSTGMGVVTAVFGAIAFYALMKNVVQRAFSLIFLLPDQILEWLGAGLPRLGADAAQISGSIDQSVTAGVSKTAGLVRRGAEGMQARYKKRAGGDLRQAADNLSNEGDRLAASADNELKPSSKNRSSTDRKESAPDLGSLYNGKPSDETGGQR